MDGNCKMYSFLHLECIRKCFLLWPGRCFEGMCKRKLVTVLRSRVVSTSLCSGTGVWGMVPKGRFKPAACGLPFSRPERIYHFVHLSFLEVKARLQFVILYLIRKCLCIINLSRTVFQPSAGSSLVSFSEGGVSCRGA